MRTDFGGAYDAKESRVRQLLDQIGDEMRRDIDAGDDLALARRAEQFCAWHTEIADVFNEALTLACDEGGHGMEVLMARQAGILHDVRATVQLQVAKQHRARIARHYAAGAR